MDLNLLWQITSSEAAKTGSAIKSLQHPSRSIPGLDGICDKELQEHIHHKEDVGDHIQNSHPGEKVALQKAGFERCKNGDQDEQRGTQGVPPPERRSSRCKLKIQAESHSTFSMMVGLLLPV